MVAFSVRNRVTNRRSATATPTRAQRPHSGQAVHRKVAPDQIDLDAIERQNQVGRQSAGC
jgi:hypothetical protein